MADKKKPDRINKTVSIPKELEEVWEALPAKSKAVEILLEIAKEQEDPSHIYTVLSQAKRIKILSD